MEQLLTLPDITATKTRSRLEEESGPGRAQSQNVQSSRLAASAQWAKCVQWWSGSPSEGGGWGALARVLYAKRPHSSQVPQSETLVELRALAKDSVAAKQASILRHQCRGGDTKVSSKVTGLLDKKPHSLGLRLDLLLPSTEILAVPPLSPPCPLSLLGETQPLITARAPSTGFIIVNNNSGQQQTLTMSQEVYSALSKGYRSK